MKQNPPAFQHDIYRVYILIALSDREESSRVQETLRQAGFSLFSFAFTGEAALAWAKRIRPNLQILSSHYPDMNGLDLYGQLCQVTSGLPVPALLLGKRRLHIETESGHRIICLETPYSSQQLLTAVETLLGQEQKSPAQF